MQLDKTLRIFFNAVKIFKKFLYKNTLKVRHASHKIEHFFILLKKLREIQLTVDICK